MHRSARATLLGLLLAPLPAVAESFTFSPNTSSFPFAWHVVFDGGMSVDNPTLHLIRGHSYDFVVAGNQSHPFYVKTVNGNGTLNGYSGFSPNAVATATTQTVSFLVPNDAPDSLFYNCSVHSSMSGKIDVSIFRDGLGD
jgi:hypothetical protein